MMQGRYNEYKGNFVRYYRSKGILESRPPAKKTPRRKVVKLSNRRIVPAEAPQSTWEEQWNRGSSPVALRNAGPRTLLV
ncbi:unnamed protein product [Allacma fusca]|uniref:Uncharacterized protein n=1 Tax=Allacma fusca TaxID=39272 RepID=A0A8J2L2Z5_9HEXA|nr:unnamed protein product [Allacma fusca]